jgi:site-specific DNA recombinase
MKSCFAYIRVSTVKQGEGVSLEAQRDAILVFALRSGITITKWFEEKETAAKSGRPVFLSMMKMLMKREALGVVLHKVDRGARNLADWAKFAELADAGIDVYFATETLDFRSRGGRLTADIQAVIASDFIRNLREETLKGIKGRLQQGLYPFGAPLGYVNNGRGKPKTIDPVKGPLVRRLFGLYVSGRYSLHSLVPEARTMGLTNERGSPITKSGVEKILQNSFYVGVIRIKTTGDTYQGIHEPLVSTQLFQDVQSIRSGKSGKKVTKHRHRYRGLFMCAMCHAAMTPERQKGHVYYRCHKPQCGTRSVREEVLEHAVIRALTVHVCGPLSAEWLRAGMGTWNNTALERIASIRLQLGQIESRLTQLTNALLDQLIDQKEYMERKHSLLMERARLMEDIGCLPTAHTKQNDRERFFERMKNVTLLHEMANDEEKRQLITLTTSNRTVSPNGVSIKPSSWIEKASMVCAVSDGDRPRTTLRSSPDLSDAQLEKVAHALASPEAQRLNELCAGIEKHVVL